jgi:hypothetical protein
LFSLLNTSLNKHSRAEEAVFNAKSLEEYQNRSETSLSKKKKNQFPKSPKLALLKVK